MSAMLAASGAVAGGVPGEDAGDVAVGRTRRARLQKSALNVTGLVTLFVVWEILAVGPFAGTRILPTPTSVARQMWDDRSFYLPHIHTTLVEALQGYLWGNFLAISLGCLFVLIPLLESLLMRLAIASYCMPIIAIGPVFAIIYGGATPKIILAALSVFFTTLIGMMLGLRSADPDAIDAVRAFGGGNAAIFLKVRLPAALPSLFSALKIAAPAAVLGAMIGEYLGGTSGLGVAIIVSEQSFNVPRTWGLAIVAAILGGIGYAITAIAARLLVPWAPDKTGGDLVSSRPSPATGEGRLLFALGRTARRIVVLAISLVLAGVLWYGFVKVQHLNSYFAKTPLDVWHYVTSDPSAGANRSQLWSNLLITLRDTFVGYVVGTAGGLVTAMAVVTNRVAQVAILPIAIALISVPLVAMVPLVILAFGNGLPAVLVIGAIVTFFPSLVFLIQGLRSVPADTYSLFNVYAASRVKVLVKLRLPCAVPSLFASARVSIPAAMLGAVLAEYLATGQGLGFLMASASVTSQFDTLWAGVVLITAVSALLYSLISAIERRTIGRYSAGGA